MPRIPSLVSALVVSSAACLLGGCGTSASPASASDASASDGAPAQEAGPGLDATVGDSGATNDAATDAGDPGACLKLAADPCLSCCEGLYPSGYLTFGQLELACACTADLCGAPDGGADGGDAGPSDGGDAGSVDGGDGGALDAGPFGSAACGTTCSAHTSPDDTCVACLRATLGSSSAPGTCGLTVVGGCVNDTDCQAYFSCVEACPN